jgi:hypothetical protein
MADLSESHMAESEVVDVRNIDEFLVQRDRRIQAGNKDATRMPLMVVMAGATCPRRHICCCGCGAWKL